jgi:hypothetical protein
VQGPAAAHVFDDPEKLAGLAAARMTPEAFRQRFGYLVR